MTTPLWAMKPRGDVRTVCCKQEPRLTVLVSVQIPLSMYRRVTKTKLSRKDVQVDAAHWDRVIWQCPGCHQVWPPGEIPPVISTAEIDREIRLKGRQMWIPKLKEVDEQCASCPFLANNDKEFVDVLQRISDHAKRGKICKARAEIARLKIKSEMSSGDFVCRQTVYRKNYASKKPEKDWRQCKGATDYWRAGGDL